MHIHAKTTRALCHYLTNTAHTDDTQTSTADLFANHERGAPEVPLASAHQAVALDRTLKRLDAKIDYVVTVAARPETIAVRVSLRRICSECGAVYHLKDIVPKVEGICDECGSKLIQREDDKEEIIRYRFEVYEMQTFPIIERYSTVGNLREISGELEIEEIPSVLEKLLSPRD